MQLSGLTNVFFSIDACCMTSPKARVWTEEGGAKAEETRLIWPSSVCYYHEVPESFHKFDTHYRNNCVNCRPASKNHHFYLHPTKLQRKSPNPSYDPLSREGEKHSSNTEILLSPPPDFSHNKNPLHKHTHSPQWKVPGRRRGMPNAPSFSHYSAR